MVDIPGRVLEVQRGSGWKIAYLYGFKVDRAVLRRAHLAWLSANVVKVVHSAKISAALAPLPPTTWHIWLCGTTSKTGSDAHNLALSKRRARAVETHLGRKFGPGAGDVQIHTGWVGEFLADVRGRRERDEIPFDRAVIVALAMQPYGASVTPPPPAPVDRDNIVGSACCALQQEHEYLSVLYDAWNLVVTTSSPGKPRLDAQGEPVDNASGPMIGPHSTFQRSLELQGWSPKRAEYLAKHGKHTQAQIDKVFDKMEEIKRDLKQIEEEKRHCTQTDPLDLCRTGEYAKAGGAVEPGGSTPLWEDDNDADVQIIYTNPGG
jgi:hypothetical protein